MSAKNPAAKGDQAKTLRDATTESLIGRHLRFGWWSLLVFSTLGIFLESLHGFKAGWYLGESNSTRRLMFTLAHAHGTLLGLLNVALAVSLPHLPGWTPRNRWLASNSLIGASVLLPAGFFLGGITIYGGDPGLGIVLVPAGALLLLTAIWLTAKAAANSNGPRLSGGRPG